MGQNQLHALGRNQKFAARRETTYATYAQPGATHAMRVRNANIKYHQEQKPRMDARQTRSHLELILGRKTVEWNAEIYILPSGTAGTPPDCFEILQTAFGTYTNTPATSDAFTLSDAQALGGMTIAHEMNSNILRQATGAWVDSFKLSLKGGDDPIITVSGGASDYFGTAPGVLNAQVNTLATTLVLTAATATAFDNNSVFQFGDGTDTNGGAGYRVTAGGGTANITFTPGLVGANALISTNVLPFFPTETVAGSPISGLLCALTLDAVTTLVTEIELEVNNNNEALRDFVGQATVPDYIPGFRDVKGSISIRASRDQIIHLQKYKNTITTSRAIVATLGSTAGSIATLSLPTLRIDMPELDVPSDKESVIKLPFIGLGSGSGANEVSLTFT